MIKNIILCLGRHGWLNWLPDKWYLKLMFRIRMGKRLNFKKTATYTEKMQWLKLYDRKPEYTIMVDKYEAKRYVAERLGEQYIIPTLGVWDDFDEINFDALPERFVLKCTHDSGGLVICRDKKNFDSEAAREKVKKCLATNYYLHGREWPYKNVRPRILAEQYMENGNNKDLDDYKFYCFNGEPKFLYVSRGLSNHLTANISYVSLDWEKQPFKRCDFADFEELPQKPLHFDTMIEFSRQLSKNIPFLRVDFYEINGRLYFGELTFFPGSGFTAFDPPEWDEKIGQWLKLPTNNEK